MSKEQLYIFDTTLRDGAQTQGVDFSIDDKEKISSALDKLGVDYVEEGWVQTTPFTDLTKRVRGRQKKKEVVELNQADIEWTKLPRHHQLMWHLLRWTGSHASESAGLRWGDIDL